MSFRVSFCSCVFSPFSIAITPLGEERANLGVWEGLRFVVVALSGLFSYLLFVVIISREIMRLIEIVEIIEVEASVEK